MYVVYFQGRGGDWIEVEKPFGSYLSAQMYVNALILQGVNKTVIKEFKGESVRLTNTKGIIFIEAYDEEMMFDGAVSDVKRDGDMLNFYRVSPACLRDLVAQGQRIIDGNDQVMSKKLELIARNQ